MFRLVALTERSFVKVFRSKGVGGRSGPVRVGSMPGSVAPVGCEVRPFGLEACWWWSWVFWWRWMPS